MKLRNLLAALTALSATAAHAHFIWLELPPADPAFAHMRFAEAPLEATDAKLQALSAPMVVKSESGAAIEFQSGDEMRVAQIDKSTKLLLGNLDYGVMDRGESGENKYLLLYHAKGAADLDHAGAATNLAVDIRAKIAAKKLTVSVFFNGQSAKNAELVLDLPGENEQIKANTNEDGQATFPIQPGGWVGIRAMVPEKVTGTHDGKPYDKARHYGTLTFPLPLR